MASGCVCFYFGSSGIRGNRDAIDPQAISLKKEKEKKKKKSTTTTKIPHISCSLITQSELQTSIILEGLVLPCSDWLDITSG